MPIASLAKVMTAYLVLREHPLELGDEGFTITIGLANVEDLHRRLELNQSIVAVEVGEELSEREALEALLLPSDNNVAIEECVTQVFASRRCDGIKPPPRISGTRARECPKRGISPHIRAYS